MNITYLLFPIIASITVVVFVIMRARSLKKNQQAQALGMKWLRLLRALLAKTQKHRGLSTAYINGDRNNSDELERLERSITEDLREVASLDRWMQENERWVGIVEHWSRLANSFKRSNDTQNNIIQHSRLIQSILYLIEEMADEHSLFSIGDGSSIEFLWKDLLHAIEYMGQARAVGSGITAKKSCSSVERIRMKYLYKKIEDNCLSITRRLPQGELAEREVQSLLQTIDVHILGPKCNLDSSQYFDMATKTIECLYQQYDQTLEQVKAA